MELQMRYKRGRRGVQYEVIKDSSDASILQSAVPRRLKKMSRILQSVIRRNPLYREDKADN
jgi:hypothetical protein